MKLQNLVMPQSDLKDQEKMYFRLNRRARLANCHQEVLFEKGGVASLDTYFNSLSIEKWRKYTKVGKISVSLLLHGSFQIQLLRKEKIHNSVAEKELLITRFSSDAPEWITLPFSSYEEKGMYAVKLKCASEKGHLLDGYYSGEMEPDQCNPVRLAIDICTFRREAFVERNLNLLNEKILNCTDSPLYDTLQVFISDNGKTLEADRLSTTKIHIVKNKNVGGAGGFTRGLLEIMHRKDYQATHVLLMDDDILLEPESLFRTYVLLRTLKEQYRDAFIGGAMLRLDHQNIQVEAGAAWYAGNLVSRKSNLNLNTLDACLYNETEEYCEFNAWWYCCIPMHIVRPDNLPLPIFIRGDDVEYGLRNMKHLILLNGICVWHEPFENKYSSFLSYYILRNMLYDNALHCPGFTRKQFLRRFVGSVIRELFYYRYKNVDLIFRGVNDFFRGVDFLKKTDGEKLHQDIMAAGYKAQPIEELPVPFEYPVYEHSFSENDGKLHKIFRLLTFNGLLVPAKRDNVVSMAKCRPYNFYRAKRVLQYDVTSKKGFVTEKKIGKTISSLLRVLFIGIKSFFHFNRAVQAFRVQGNELMTQEFWEKYLVLRAKD